MGVTLDIRTLILTLSITSLIISCVLFLFAYVNKGNFKGIAIVGTAMLILSFSFAVNGLNDRVPFVLGISSSMMLYCLGFYLVFRGYSLFIKKKPKPLIDLIFIPFYFLLSFYFTYRNNTEIRIILVSIMVIFYSARMTYITFRFTPSYGKFSFRIYGFCVALLGILFTGRIIVTLLYYNNHPTSLLGAGNSQALFLLVALIFIILLSIFFIFLINLELLFLKDRFISVLSHEIKNTFSAIINFSEILLFEKEHKTSKGKHIYRNINAASRDGYDSLTSLLEWSKSRLGISKIELEEFCLAHLCHKILKDYEALANLKNIVVALNAPDKITLRADKTLNNIIIRNLLSNAIKFTPVNGIILIDISAHNNYFLLSVKDSGKGISRQVIDQILSNNVPYTSTGTSNEKGTGIGLHLCKVFIEQQGGQLKIRSVKNEGSNFSYTIPR